MIGAIQIYVIFINAWKGGNTLNTSSLTFVNELDMSATPTPEETSAIDSRKSFQDGNVTKLAIVFSLLDPRNKADLDLDSWPPS